MIEPAPATYFELEPEQNPFSTLMADITHRCNMECANCYIPNRVPPDMDADAFGAFLGRLPKRTNIRLIGAEPTMRDDLPDLIRLVRKQGHRPTLVTNGLKLKQESYVRKLVDAGLRNLAISLNGADDDSVYRILDGGKFAAVKLAALDHCVKHRLMIGTNTILVRGINDRDTPQRVMQCVLSLAEKYNRRFKRNNPTMLRFKSVGQIGRFVVGEPLSMEEMAALVCKPLGINPGWALQQTEIYGLSECGVCLFPCETEHGTLYIKLTDWQVNEEGVPDPGNPRRGRITPDWKVAPFFEHVKLNEGGY